MKGFTIVKYNKDRFHRWNDFVSQAKNAPFLFHRDFMDYHGDRFEDFSLMVYNKEKLLALLPANRAGQVLQSHQGLTYGGLLVCQSMKFQLFLDCFKQILNYLAKNEFEVFKLKKLPFIYCSQPNDELDYLLFTLGAKHVKSETLSVIDLQNEFRINSNRLEGKKRGEKSGLQIKEEEDFSEFWKRILTPNLQQKHNVLPVHSLEEIELLKSLFPNNIRQFNVYHNDKIVAGTTIFESPLVAHAQYISGNAENNRLGSLDFLYCHLIQNVFQDKRYFDFGSSNENMGKNINRGLQFWKEGFGARTVCQNYYELEIKNHKLLDSILI